MPQEFRFRPRGPLNTSSFASRRCSPRINGSKVEVRPGNRSVVHHLVVFTANRTRRFSKPQTWSRLRSACRRPGLRRTTRPGYSSTRPAPRSSSLCSRGWWQLKPGQARLVKAGSDLIFQGALHDQWNPGCGSNLRRSGLCPDAAPGTGAQPGGKRILICDPPAVRLSGAGNRDSAGRGATGIALPAHARSGKAFEYRAIYPDGESEVLLRVPRYDFNWQPPPARTGTDFA
jgi:hypothetical protein